MAIRRVGRHWPRGGWVGVVGGWGRGGGSEGGGESYIGRRMKYAIIIPDGAADEPLKELGGKTPLEAADTPNMDRIAMEGRQGLARTVPDGFESGSDVATMCLLGYDPDGLPHRPRTARGGGAAASRSRRPTGSSAATSSPSSTAS